MGFGGIAFFERVALFFGLLISSAEASSVLLVTDIDDTLKITHVQSKLDTVWNGFFGDSVFSGMKELIQAMNSHSKQLVYLSGSPQSLESRLTETLFRKKGFPRGQFILNNWFQWEDNYRFKLIYLTSVLADTTDGVVLIGDDTEKDPEVFDAVINRFGKDRVLGAYIHSVSHRALPDSVTPFSTAFDIALNEFEKYRLESEDLMKIRNSIVDEGNIDLLFPYFVYCPTHFEYSLGPRVLENADLRSVALQFAAYVRTLCEKSWVVDF